MKDADQVLVFSLDERQYALHLSAVKRVVRAVEVTPLPKAPEIVLGVVNLQGRIIPVFDLRSRFRLPKREINLSDQLILAHTTTRMVALIVDSVMGVVGVPDREMVGAHSILPDLEYVEGAFKLEDGVVLIHNLDRFLSLEETRALDQVMAHA
jgi:purine-binding chemotaxis protein CheW